MKRNTIKWRIFKYNLLTIFLLIALTTVIFNVAINIYFERDIANQLDKISRRIEDTALRKGPDFFRDSKPGSVPPPPKGENDMLGYYFMLDRSLREPLTLLNADYVLLNKDKQLMNPLPDKFFQASSELMALITDEAAKLTDSSHRTILNLTFAGNHYVAAFIPVQEKNSFGLGWIVIFSSLQKVNQLRLMINLLLLSILVFSSIIIAVFSSMASKRISSPLSSLSQHISDIAERKFGTKIHMPEDDEFVEFANNVNLMSEKLESYDKAQKTFLQNASHEFRTPLMSIQSYAEGLQYHVIDEETASRIIIDESKRMARLVDDLLYLSRLDTIEETYHHAHLDFGELVRSCTERLNGIAQKDGIQLRYGALTEGIKIYGDEEKLSRGLTNILSNCLRYAKSHVNVNLSVQGDQSHLEISDDGTGIDEDQLPYIFDRFYKGNNGNSGLGLAITKSVIEKHNGTIRAQNTENGALFIVEIPLQQ